MFFDAKKNEVALILDIGNGSVGGALAILSKGHKPKTLFSLRELFSFEEKPDAEKLQLAVFRALDKTLSEILSKGFKSLYFKKNPQKIDTVLCVLSSPWFISKGKTIVVSQNKKFLITERFLDEILSKELETFEKSLAGQEGAPPTRLIEKNLVSMKINGYVLKDAIGQKATHFETSLYISLADEAFIKKISDSISKHTHIGGTDIIFNSFPLIAFSTISDLFPGIRDYLHFDIAGEITDIALVRGGLIQKTVSYPTGTNLLIRRIAERLSVPNQVARSFYHLFMDKRTQASSEAEIQQALWESESEWNVYLTDALVSLGNPRSSEITNPETDVAQVALPGKVFVTAYARTFELFNEFLKMQKSDETSEWRKGLSITYLGPELLEHFLEANPLQPFDAFTALEALFLSNRI